MVEMENKLYESDNDVENEYVFDSDISHYDNLDCDNYDGESLNASELSNPESDDCDGDKSNASQDGDAEFDKYTRDNDKAFEDCINENVDMSNTDADNSLDVDDGDDLYDNIETEDIENHDDSNISKGDCSESINCRNSNRKISCTYDNKHLPQNRDGCHITFPEISGEMDTDFNVTPTVFSTKVPERIRKNIFQYCNDHESKNNSNHSHSKWKLEAKDRKLRDKEKSIDLQNEVLISSVQETSKSTLTTRDRTLLKSKNCKNYTRPSSIKAHSSKKKKEKINAIVIDLTELSDNEENNNIPRSVPQPMHTFNHPSQKPNKSKPKKLVFTQYKDFKQKIIKPSKNNNCTPPKASSDIESITTEYTARELLLKRSQSLKTKIERLLPVVENLKLENSLYNESIECVDKTKKLIEKVEYYGKKEKELKDNSKTSLSVDDRFSVMIELDRTERTANLWYGQLKTNEKNMQKIIEKLEHYDKNI